MAKVEKFRFWCQKILPLVYDDSLSYYELLCKVVTYLNNVINTVNETTEQVSTLTNLYTELQKYVDDYFENLDVQDEINNKLDSMVEDGTFNELFGLYFNDIKNTHDGTLYVTKLGRIDVTQYANDFVGCCAGVMCDSENYLTGMYSESGSVLLLKVNIKTGNVLSNIVSEMYHGNGACKLPNGNVLFSDYRHNNVYLYTLSEVNPISLTMTKRSINGLPENVQPFLGLGSDSEYIYIVATNEVYVVDFDYNYIRTITLTIPQFSTTYLRQGGVVYNGFIGLVMNIPNIVVCFNFDGSYSHTLVIGQNQFGNNIGEVQNVDVIGNDVYFHSFNYNHRAIDYSEIAFYSAPIKSNGIPVIPAVSNELTFTNTNNRRLIVNRTAYNSLNNFNKFTANGSSKPYSCLSEALLNMEDNCGYVVTVVNGANETVTINNKNITLIGQSGAMRIINSKVNLQSVLFNSDYTFSQYGESYKTPIICNNSLVTFSGHCSLLAALITDYSMCIFNSVVVADYQETPEPIADYTPIFNSSYKPYVSQGGCVLSNTTFTDLKDVAIIRDVRVGEFTINNIPCAGFITSSSSSLVFTIPTVKNVNGLSVQTNTISVTAFSASGRIITTFNARSHISNVVNNGNSLTYYIDVSSLSLTENNVALMINASVTYTVS